MRYPPLVPGDDLLDSPAAPSLKELGLAWFLREFASAPRLDQFGGIHAPGNDYEDLTVASMNCVIAAQDFHDFLAAHAVLSAYVTTTAPDHVANLIDDLVIDWTLRQFDSQAEVPTVEPLTAYRERFRDLQILPPEHANVYSKDETYPYWWSVERRQAFATSAGAPTKVVPQAAI